MRKFISLSAQTAPIEPSAVLAALLTLWRVSPVAGRSGEGLLTEPTAAIQGWRPELVVMPP